MDKTPLLKEIRDQVWDLKNSPLYAYRVENGNYPVLGEGSHDAKIMFVGEAPGKNEAKTGKPFCGRAGALLDELLQSIGLPRQNVYITNIVKDRPPENRDPFPDEIALYGPYLDRQIDIIHPKVIAALGRFSAAYIFNLLHIAETRPISATHGEVFEGTTSYGTIAFVPLYHPAAAIYNQSLKETLVKDFQALKRFI
jgi:DNA polymerase